MKKLQTELTDEELLKLLEDESVEVLGKTVPKKQHKLIKVMDFVSKYNIKSGNFKIFTGTLYQLFKLEYPDVTDKSFTYQMRKLVPSEKHRRYTVFFINKDLLDISKSVQHFLTDKKQQISRKRNLKRHIEGFINFFKLSPGSNAVQFEILADLYDLWTYKTKKKKLKDSTVATLLKLYIPHEKIKERRYFKLDNGIFKVVSERQLKNIKATLVL